MAQTIGLTRIRICGSDKVRIARALAGWIVAVDIRVRPALDDDRIDTKGRCETEGRPVTRDRDRSKSGNGIGSCLGRVYFESKLKALGDATRVSRYDSGRRGGGSCAARKGIDKTDDRGHCRDKAGKAGE